MKVDVAEVNANERRMMVSIPAESVDHEMGRAYQDLKKNVRLKGFRPGKAPLSLLKSYFKAQVEEDVISKLVKETYPKALDEVNVLPVSQPRIENGTIETGKEFTYTAVFDVKPELEVGGYEGIELGPEAGEVTDADVKQELESLRNSHATLNAVEGRALQQGDCASLDIEATFEGKPCPAVSRKDFMVDIIEDGFVPGFTGHLVGLEKGASTTFTLAMPEDYPDRDLAGQSVEFSVQLKEIKEKILPAVDDEFAKDLGDLEGLDDLKSKIRESLQERQRQQCERERREKIFDVLIEKNSFEVPPSMVENQVRNMVFDLQQRLKAQGLDLDDMGQSLGGLFDQYKQPAERQVRSALLLEAIAKKEAIEAEESDYEEKYEEIAGQLGQNVSSIKEKLDRELLKPQIIEKKALNLIISKAIIADK